MLGQALKLAEHKCTESNISYTTQTVSLTEEQVQRIAEILSKEIGLSDTIVAFINSHPIIDIDAIAVTEGPGLEPALWVGVSFAKALSIALQKPIIPVNHMEGHIVSVLYSEKNTEEHELTHEGAKDTVQEKTVQFPVLSLLISGGHTELVLSKDWHEYEVIGQTVDDAIGEAFDKVARLMNLPYPGGPKISKLAEESRVLRLRETNLQEDSSYIWNLPRPMLKSPDFNFSFSGLKTAVLYAVRDKTKSRTLEYKNAHTQSSEHTSEHVASLLSDVEIKTLAEEFENAVTDVLVHKTSRALRETGAVSLIIGGGVIANTYIRNAFIEVTKSMGIPLFTPSVSLSTDNSVMIAIAGYLRWISNDTENKHRILYPSHVHELTAKGNLSL
jgi:N6-L-threonylcarbamoyladenine synthase